MKVAGATALIVDAHRTLMLDAKHLIELADQEEIAVLGMPRWSNGAPPENRAI